MPVLKLFSLYDEEAPLPIPKGRNAVRKLSAAAIYVHLQRKLASQHGDSNKEIKTNYLPYSLPIALRGHYEYLQKMSAEPKLDIAQSINSDFKVAILCNTFSTAQDYFQVIIGDMIKIIAGGGKISCIQCSKSKQSFSKATNFLFRIIFNHGSSPLGRNPNSRIKHQSQWSNCSTLHANFRSHECPCQNESHS